jgi:hypothetical protein
MVLKSFCPEQNFAAPFLLGHYHHQPNRFELLKRKIAGYPQIQTVFTRAETFSVAIGYRKLLLTISRKAPVPLRAEHPTVFLHEIRVKMQENDKITCTGVPYYLLKTRFAGGGGFLNIRSRYGRPEE